MGRQDFPCAPYHIARMLLDSDDDTPWQANGTITTTAFLKTSVAQHKGCRTGCQGKPDIARPTGPCITLPCYKYLVVNLLAFPVQSCLKVYTRLSYIRFTRFTLMNFIPISHS